ncbi:hypothetical protein MN116_002430 [Schistosoma mekongi]|uniref:CTLH domain-containing protein n=1 Tax=Schistosoma mekongi TaxID=38744 RepID=A0AAE1ZK72_SCHME|nr:hypothetical protein MN116_002430 [Schistosoma mekongi]
MLQQNGDVLYGQFNGVAAIKNDYLVSRSRSLSVRDQEMLRLIGQYLCDKGFNGTYTQLSRESGITLEHNDATELRHAILEGRWYDAEAAIDKLAPMIGDTNSVEEVRFLILEQQFLEHLEANEVIPAVTLLRNRITPMQRNTERVHTLASCLMCRTAVELQAQAGGWAGVDAGSRLQLINRIHAFIPAQTMLPPGRLEELINESVRAQLASCIFHNPPLGVQTDIHNISLLQRHSCGMQDFPAFCIQTLDHQRDSDLWFCQFSPDGCYLATGGKDANVDVWRVDTVRHAVTFFRVLTTPAYIGCLCWSPDSKKLAACCGEEQSSVLVFDVSSGQQLCSQKVNDEDVYSTASFFSDSRKLAFGGLKGSFYVMDTEDQGRVLAVVEGYRVQSMAAIYPPIPSMLLPNGTESVQVNPPPPDRSIPGAPDSPVNNGLHHQNGSTVDTTANGSRPEGQIDQLLVADSLHRIRLFRFGLVCSSTSNNANVTTDTADIPLSTVTSSPYETSTTSISTVTISTLSGSSYTQTPSEEITTSTTISTTTTTTSSSALAAYLSATSGNAPGAPSSISSISTSATTGTTNPGIGGIRSADFDSSDNNNNSNVITGSSTGENPGVATALAVARLAQQQQQRLLQSSNNPMTATTNPASTASLTGHLSSWYQQPTSYQGSTSLAYTSGSSTLPPGILLDMPILPVSLTRLGPPTTQGLQTQLGLQPIIHPAGSLHGSSPYTVVSSSGANSLGTTGSSLTILFGAPLDRTSASYATTPVGASSGSATTTPTGVRALAAAAAALANVNNRQVHSVSSGTTMLAVSTSLDTSGIVTGRSSISMTNIGSTVVSTSTSTTGGITAGSASNLTTVSSSTPATGFSTSTTSTTTSAHTSGLSTNGGSNYGLLDHRTLFKETHPVQSIMISRSGTTALLTIHKMGLHLWDLEACAILQRFVGHKQDTFRLYSTFGGANEDFVATGSENGRIHIWHIGSGSHPIHSSPGTGNRDPITCVHWNPVLPTMIASVNDAGELCIWGPQRYALGNGQPMDSST